MIFLASPFFVNAADPVDFTSNWSEPAESLDLGDSGGNFMVTSLPYSEGENQDGVFIVGDGENYENFKYKILPKEPTAAEILTTPWQTANISDPYGIEIDVRQDSWSIIQDANGNLWIFFTIFNFPKGTLYYLYSEDDGVNWTVGREATDSDLFFYFEPSTIIPQHDESKIWLGFTGAAFAGDPSVQVIEIDIDEKIVSYDNRILNDGETSVNNSDTVTSGSGGVLLNRPDGDISIFWQGNSFHDLMIRDYDVSANQWEASRKVVDGTLQGGGWLYETFTIPQTEQVLYFYDDGINGNYNFVESLDGGDSFSQELTLHIPNAENYWDWGGAKSFISGKYLYTMFIVYGSNSSQSSFIRHEVPEYLEEDLGDNENDDLIEDEENNSLDYQKYKEYKDKYKNDKNKSRYFRIKQLKKNQDISYFEMKKIYEQYKKADSSVVKALDRQTQKMFKDYRGYRGYKHYREYLNRIN